MYAKVEVGDNCIKRARILVAKEGTKALIGRDWLKQLQYEITPTQMTADNSIMRITEIEMDEEGQRVSENFPRLFIREGKINKFKLTTQFEPNLKPSQQRGRRIPIQLQEAVNEEINRMIKKGKIEKVKTIKEDVFIHPTVITVKKDRTVKIAIDTRKMND